VYFRDLVFWWQKISSESLAAKSQDTKEHKNNFCIGKPFVILKHKLFTGLQNGFKRIT